MTKQQIINFAKAPFSRSFGIAYVLTLTNFLLIPLLSDLFNFILKNHEKLSEIDMDELKESFIPSLSMGHIVLALTGFFLSVILLGGYKAGLIYKTFIEKKDIFEASKIQLSFSFISSSIVKYLSASLTCLVLFILPVFIFGGLIALGMYASISLKLAILSVCMTIIVFISFFILLYKIICYLFTAGKE